MEMFYGPEEDTYFMIDALKEYFETDKNRPKKTIEIGVGNGQVSKYISSYSKDHMGVDINPFAIKETKRICQNGEYFESDLFSKVRGKFDLIVFNPPYLPEKKDEDDDWIKKAIVGGKKGYEIIVRFLEDLPKYLEDCGKCFLLFSSHSRQDVILEKIKELMLECRMVLKKSIMLEEIYVYEIVKSELLTELEGKGYRDIKFFAKGSHGRIFTAIKKDCKYAIKILNENSFAFDAIKNEAEKMQFVNKVNIGPEFVEYCNQKNYMIYKFIEGTPMQKYYSKISIKEIESIVIEIINQCKKLDDIGFEKKEMKRPNRNVLIQNKKPILIDFERGVIRKNPGNLTQFLQYLFNSKFALYLNSIGIFFDRKEIMDLGLKYKNKEIETDKIIEYVRAKFLMGKKENNYHNT